MMISINLLFTNAISSKQIRVAGSEELSHKQVCFISLVIKQSWVAFSAANIVEHACGLHPTR